MLKKIFFKLGLSTKFFENRVNSFRNYKMAFRIHESLAHQGNVKAQEALGYMYEYGKGIKQDYKKAKEWYKKSCDNGEQKACDVYEKLNKAGY